MTPSTLALRPGEPRTARPPSYIGKTMNTELSNQAGSSERRAWREARLFELRRELQALMLEEEQAAGVDSQVLREQCREMKLAGRAIEATKLYRQRVGCSLREAHVVVQAL